MGKKNQRKSKAVRLKVIDGSMDILGRMCELLTEIRDLLKGQSGMPVVPIVPWTPPSDPNDTAHPPPWPPYTVVMYGVTSPNSGGGKWFAGGASGHTGVTSTPGKQE